MRVSVLTLLAATVPAFAQNSSYFVGLLQTLAGAGLTRVVSVTQNITNTTTGQALLADLPNGNKTLFAPNDNAFTGTPPSNITDPNMLANILSYHVAIGSFTNFSEAPQHTIARTELNASEFVMLEGNKSQVLVLTTENCTGKVLQQNIPVSVVSTTTYQNLIIHVVDAVFNFPPTLSMAISSHNLSAFAAGAQQSGLIESLEAAHGVTIFAPTDAALSAANQTIGNNQTLLQTVVDNHIINGTSVYSTQLLSGNYTSAAGEPFRFSNGSSGEFVSSGSSTARIIQSDVLLSNGVMYIIDSVLLNAQNNTQAANSAFASATSAAAQSSIETTGVGATSTPPSATSTPPSATSTSPSATSTSPGTSTSGATATSPGATSASPGPTATGSGSSAVSSGTGGGTSNGAAVLEIHWRQWAAAFILVLTSSALVL